MAFTFDAVGKFSFALFLVTLISYFIIVGRVYTGLRLETEKLSVLIARVAFFLPFYAFFMFIAAGRPQSLVGVNIPIAFMEGYTFYCFFALIVYNLGGPKPTVRAFDNGKELACCNPCCPSDAVVYFKRTGWAMFHLCTTRPLIVILAAIASYSKARAGVAVAALLNLIAAVMLFYCLAHLLLLYENIFDKCVNFYGVMKMFLLKFTVGLIVIQGIIAAFMVAFGSEPYSDDSTLDAEEKTIRGYCMLVLFEYAILCIPYVWAFTYEISDPPKPIHDPSVTLDTNLCFFLCKVLNIFDVFGTITYKDDEATAAAPPSAEKDLELSPVAP